MLLIDIEEHEDDDIEEQKKLKKKGTKQSVCELEDEWVEEIR